MSSESKRIFDFGHFQVNEAKRLLLRDGQEVQKDGKRLPNKAFDLLLLLIERRDEKFVSKADVVQNLWGKVDVLTKTTDLQKLIVKLRRALDDDATRQEIIRTIHGDGYKFIKDVRELDTQAASDGPLPIVGTLREPDSEPESQPPPPIVGDRPAPKDEPESDPSPPNPRRWRLAIMLVAALMLIVILGVVLFLLRPQDCLQIALPNGNLIRTDRHPVRVTGAIPDNTHLWIFVELKGGRYGWFPQKTARTKDGWEANAYFGNAGEQGEFEAVGVAVDAKTDQQMEELYKQENPVSLKNLPEAVAGCRSEYLNVTKNPGP